MASGSLGGATGSVSLALGPYVGLGGTAGGKAVPSCANDQETETEAETSTERPRETETENETEKTQMTMNTEEHRGREAATERG